MKYKSTHWLRKESQAISSWFNDQMAQFDRVNGLAKAVFDDDRDMLAKSASPDLDLAKADVDAMRRERGSWSEEALKNFVPAWRLAKIMREWKERTDALDEDMRRSRRLNAAWHSLPPYGPWSEVH